mgnify:CR=1 FL=1
MKKAVPAIFLIFTLILDLCVGGGSLSWATGAVLWKLRVPRVLTALIAGGALAASGAARLLLAGTPPERQETASVS